MLEKGSLDLSDLAAGGSVTLTGTDGRTLAIRHNPANDMPIVHRNGQLHDWDEHWDLYKTAPDSPNPSPVTLGWQDGTLRVQAGGHVFEGTFTQEGEYRFRNGRQ